MSYPPKYLNPFTDFGFKKIFGTEASKPLLIDFLNAVLQLADPIKDLSFKNLEQLGSSDLERKAIYDIFCESAKGEKFIVELQKANQKFFKDRTVYYATFPIQQQAERGDWNYRLSPIYCVNILNFRFQDDVLDKEPKVLHRVQLKDQDDQVFYQKLMLVYLEMPNFTLELQELADRKDQWLYFLKHLEDFESIPELFKDEIFEQAFEVAAIARMNNEDHMKYQGSLKVLRDNFATMQQAEIAALERGLEQGLQEGLERGKAEGIQEGLEQGLQEGLERGALEAKLKVLQIARGLKTSGMELEQIILITGLSLQELEGM
jgi:predicted transposase/invertase (TIGR01784 family)